jgi:DNA ligase-1
MYLYELFEKIRKEPRQILKIKYLRDFPDQEKLKRILKYTYDIGEVFNIRYKERCGRIGLDKEIPVDIYSKIKTIRGRNEKIKLIENTFSNLSLLAQKYAICVLNKDLKIGINTKLINRAFGEEVIKDFPIMLAHKQNERRWNNNFKGLLWCFYNEKIDGVRCTVKIGNNKNDINFLSREGRLLPKFVTSLIRYELESNFEMFKNMELDAEIASSHFQNIMRILERKNVDANSIYLIQTTKLHIFDFVHLKDKPLHQRVDIMESFQTKNYTHSFNFVKFVKYYKVKADYDLISKIARKYIDCGREGIIIKHPDSLYEAKRSNFWLKFKDKNTMDLEILAIYPGEPGTKFENTLGGFVLKYKNTRLHCGSGFSEEERDKFWKEGDSLIGKICEISYMEETKTGSLRHPVFEIIRWDKTEADW